MSGQWFLPAGAAILLTRSGCDISLGMVPAMGIPADQARINQLLSPYSPDHPPQLALDFGDFLSLLWWVDASAEKPSRAAYYRQCADAVACGLGFNRRSVYRMIKVLPAGHIYVSLPNLPYRGTIRLVDAQDRREAMFQLLDIRSHILSMGSYRSRWSLGWPGSRVADEELRARLFAVFFTAFEGQFNQFSRLLLVVDIMLQDLMLGDRMPNEISLSRLIQEFGYPDPTSINTRMQYG